MQRLFKLFVIGTLVAGPVLAQEGQTPQPEGRGQTGRAGQARPTQPTPPATRAVETVEPPRVPMLPSLPNPAANVKLELAITDTYGGAPSKKVVTLLIENDGSGMIRTSNHIPDGSLVLLNIDGHLRIFPNGIISAVLTFQYTPAQSAEGRDRSGAEVGRVPVRPADLNESVSVLLQDGKTVVVSQSADPATDRKVTVEVTATIVKG